MMANTEGYRLVRCPKCLNVLPEPANVTVYQCGGCGTTLRAKIRTSSGRHVAPKQGRQDSDSYSVATTASNGVPPRNKDEASAGAATDGSSCTADASGTVRDHDSGSTRRNEDGDDVLQPAEKNAGVVEDTTEGEDHRISEEQSADSSEEAGPAGLDDSNGTPLDDSCKAETPAAGQCAEKPDAGNDDDSERGLNNASENTTLDSERSKVAVVGIQGSDEQKGAGETEHEVNRKSYLQRTQSRSCDLRASGSNSLDFHSARTSIQSKSFRASEPLQSKIMHSVDELKGDLTELFSKPSSDCKPVITAHRPPRPKQDGVGGYTSAPLAGYRPAARHSGHATRLSMSGQQVAPRGLPSPRYRRHRGYSGYPAVVEQVVMERRPCYHECCHSCRPPCYRSCSHEHKPAPVKEVRRRAPPKHHCRPVLRGSPFVICSKCLRLVQLPTDFTVPSKGARRLQCGSCSQVVSYSYRDPGRKKLQSPLGGDGGYNTDDDHCYGFFAGEALADPVSYSEEHGLSFGASYSTSTEEDGQPLYVSRNSSFNTVDEGGVASRDGKLHRLMGYSSARELLRRSPDLFESFEFDGRAPDAGTTRDRKGKGVCGDDGSGERERDRHSPVKRSKGRRSAGGLPFQGILRKGIHGLESLKLRS